MKKKNLCWIHILLIFSFFAPVLANAKTARERRVEKTIKEARRNGDSSEARRIQRSLDRGNTAQADRRAKEYKESQED